MGGSEVIYELFDSFLQVGVSRLPRAETCSGKPYLE